MRPSPCRLAILAAALALALLRPAAAWQAGADPSALLDEAQSILVTDTERGVALAVKAAQAEREADRPRRAVLLRAAWLQAEGLFRLRRLDAAAEVLRTTRDSFEPDGSEIYGKLLIASGRIARARGDNGLALESFQEAFTTFASLGNARYQAIALQSIGTLYANAKQYERAIAYDERAVETHPDDPVIRVVSLNNRGNALRQLGRYDEARAMFQEALRQEIVRSAPNFAVRLQSNLASLELAAGNTERAAAAAEAVMTLAETMPANQVPRLPYAVKAMIALENGDRAAARQILDRAFAGVDFDATPEDEREAHALAFEVYEALGAEAAALDHLKAFKRLEDAERDVAASANYAILNAEFELSNKELEIEKLRSERLEKDVQLIRAKRQQERLLLIGAVLIALAVIAFLVWQTVQSGRVRRITEALNRKLEAVNAKLRVSNIRLEKANSAKTEFLATTSHEVRTPLNAVINLTADVLERDDLAADVREKLATALSSAEHLHEIVSDVLDVARFEGKRVEAHLGEVDLRRAVGDVVQLWRPRAEDKGLDFSVDIDLPAGNFCTDERLIRQVLSNLLSNAIKFTPHGSVRLSASGGTAARPLEIRVSDSGIGIARENQDVIFESFRQVDTGGTRNFQGTGLGLAICKQIADLLGGSLTVESEVGYGTTFTFTAPPGEREQPAEIADTPERTMIPPDVDGLLHGLHVLAAEDNAVNAMVIQTILKGKVDTLTIVENGQEAVEAVSVGDFDMVLMDKQMPVMDGVEATRRIRALPGAKADIPIVAVTADAFAAAREELLAAGVNDYLAKPVKPEDLKRAIAASLRRRTDGTAADAGTSA